MRLLAAVLGLLLAAAAMPAHAQGAYATTPSRTCGGYPRAPIGMADGFCAGIVYAPAPGVRGLRRQLPFPRTVLPLADGDILVVDMGGWVPNRGSVWRMTPRSGRAPAMRQVLARLNMPHMAAYGPDGRLYLGEMHRIIRFDPDAADPQASIETVIPGLPPNSLHGDRHPLSSFIFDGEGAFIVNVGAPSDQCASPTPRAGALCADSTGRRTTAALWRYPYLGNSRWSAAPETFAEGLRNSLPLVRHRSGTILQGENSIDLAGAETPFDEINMIVQGRHYGWPYCMDINAPTPAWRTAGGDFCRTRATAPAMLLPPHSAPLSMLYYEGAMFPQLRGRLIVSLHGYRPGGARIIAYEVDARGVPVTAPRAAYALYQGATSVRRRYPAAGQDGLILTPGWNAARGVRPMGTPVGLAIAPDGAIWVAEDKNGTILRIAAE